MATIIKTMVTIINKMTKSKWRFASVHKKRYSFAMAKTRALFVAICTNQMVLKLGIRKNCDEK